MSPALFASVALRVWGLILLAGAIWSCPLNVFLLTISRRGLIPGDPARLPALIAAFMTAGVLIFLADYLVYWAGVPDAVAPAADRDQLGAAAFAVVALWAIVVGIRRGLVDVFALIGSLPRSMPEEMASRIRSAEAGGLASSVVSIAAGVLVLHRDGIAVVLRRLGRQFKDLHDPPMKE